MTIWPINPIIKVVKYLNINPKTISFGVKKFIAKSLTAALKVATFGLISLDKVLKLFKVPFSWISNTIFKTIVLPNFGRYLWIKSRVSKKTSNKAERLIYTLTNKYVIHLIIIVIALGVTTSNILAYESKDNYGRDAIIYEIIGLEDLEVIEDSVTAANDPKIYSYLGDSFQVESDIFSESQKREEELYLDQYKTDISTTEGELALIKPELASTESAKITRTSTKKYTIQEGDVISIIASQFGVSVNTILWANNLSSSSYIKPGQEILIPPTTGVLHTVQKGDTLSSIAKKYDSSESKIKSFNNIDNDLLVVGESVMVPDGRIVYTYAPRTYTAPSVPAPAYSAPTTASSNGMIWPSSCRRITQYYKGWLHTGVDIACGMSKQVKAAADGVVSRVQYGSTGYGYNVIINHGGGKETLYGHASWIYVEVGQTVKQGEVIMLEGSTGRSTGPHVHFEVRLNGNRVNPLNYIR